MSTKYKMHNPAGIYFLSIAVVEWVDVFTRREYCELIVESLRYCITQKGLILHAWCIMPNHLHLIASATEGQKLSPIIRDFKKYTAVSILKAIEANTQESRKRWMLWLFRSNGQRNPNNLEYQFWQPDNHPIELTNNLLQDQKLHYLHQNPVSLGLVTEPEHWYYCSASTYAGSNTILPLYLLQ